MQRQFLVSVTRCGSRDATQVAMLVREFPRVPTVALLTDLDPASPTAVLTLGRSGVQTLVDVRQPAGWRRLRDVLLADQSRDISGLALAQLAVDLAGAHPDCWRFFEDALQSPQRRRYDSRSVAASPDRSEHIDESFLPSQSASTKTIPRHGATRSCSATLRESWAVSRECSKPPRLLLSTKLRPACSRLDSTDRSRISAEI